MIYLYLKTHRQTGLKYLGKTTQDPYIYRGSGVHWVRHINKHGYDVDTKILVASDDIQEIKAAGIFYSHLWNVVESSEFANLCVERGDGGFPILSEELSQARAKKIGAILKGRKQSSEHVQKRADARRGKGSSLKGKSVGPNNRGNAISIALKSSKKTCPHCGKIGGSSNMTRYHFDNCKKVLYIHTVEK